MSGEPIQGTPFDRARAMLDLLHAHRSIRRYKDVEVPDEDIEAAVRAGQCASTSSAVQACSVIQVTRPEERASLVGLSGGQQKVADSGAFFVICGDTRRHRLVVQRNGAQYEARLEGFLLAMIDATLMAQNMVIAFEAMGYGICYIGGIRNALSEVAKLLELPVGLYPLYGLCVGVPDEQPIARPRLKLASVWCKDRYHDDDQALRLVDEYDARYRAYLRRRGAPEEAIDRGWSGAMAGKFATAARTELAVFYKSQGADLT